MTSEFIDPSGARIVVDTVSLPYVKGSTVDWEDSLVRTGFVVSKNPNASESCSCGTSFTAKTVNPYECVVCFQRCRRLFAVNTRWSSKENSKQMQIVLNATRLKISTLITVTPASVSNCMAERYIPSFHHITYTYSKIQ